MVGGAHITQQRGSLPVWAFALIGIGSLVIQLAALALPLLSLQLYDRILPGRSVETLIILVAGVGLCIGVEVTMRHLRARLISALEGRRERQRSADVFNHIWRTAGHSEAARRIHPDTLISAFRPPSRLDQNSAQTRVSAAFDCGLICAIFGGLSILSWKIVVTAVLIALCYLGALALHWRGPGTTSQRGLAVLRRFKAATQQTLRQRHALAALPSLDRPGNGATVLLTSHSVSRAHRRYSQIARESARPLLAGQSFSEALLLGVLCVGVLEVDQDILTLGGLMAVLFLSARMTAPLVRLSHAIGTRLRPAERMQSEAAVLALGAKNELEEPGKQHSVSALAAQSLVLDGAETAPLSLGLRAGEYVHISGEDQSLIHMLMETLSGQRAALGGTVVLAKGVRCAYLNGQTHLFNGTLLENITHFDPALRDQALEVADHLSLDARVAQLPLGYTTPIIKTPEAAALTPTLRHLVWLTAQLARRPNILLIHAVDSGLDGPAYNALTGLLARIKGQASLLIASDDANLINLADRHLRITPDGIITAAAPRRTAALPLRLRGLRR